MEVLDNDGKIVFLRKLKEGPAAESYGIHVAQLAGLSEQVLRRAWQIMELLKERDSDLSETFHSEKIIQHGETSVNQNKKQVNKENIPPHISKIEKILDDVDPDKITPLEALNLICQWKKLSLIGISQQKQTKPVKEENSNLSLFD
jgi:DNA mismatch repair protein MutS